MDEVKAANRYTEPCDDSDTDEVEAENRYAEPWDDSDIVLVVEDTEFHVHYLMLKFNSPVFSKMFSSDFIESKEKRVELPGKEMEYFIVFLDLLYPLSASYDVPTDIEVLEKVLQYAHEYQVNIVKFHADNVIAFKIYAHADVMQGKMSDPIVPLPKPYLPFKYSSIVQKAVPAVSSATKLALQHLRMADTYGLKESLRLIMTYLISEDSCTSYENTIFDQLSSEMKYRIVKGKMKKFFDNATFERGKPNSILLEGMGKSETQFTLLQSMNE